jgi:hypothetical protein
MFEMLSCCDVIASSFVAKVQGEFFVYFEAFAVKRHSSIRNWNEAKWRRGANYKKVQWREMK